MTASSLRPIVEASNLVVEFPASEGMFRALDGVDFEARPEECVGLIGESGSGKSTLALAVGGINRAGRKPSGGSIRTFGKDVFSLEGENRRRFLSREIGFIFQNPVTSLDPTRKIGSQFYSAAGPMPPEDIADLLKSVGIHDASRILSAFPREMSGGMAQRICIAMAIASRPKLLVADEPTSALDAAVRMRILDLLAETRKRTQATLILVSHDLRAVRQCCDRIYVMRAGKIVEVGPTEAVIEDPQHEYTKDLMRAGQVAGKLIRSSRSADEPAPPSDEPAVISLKGVRVRYPKGPPWARTFHDAVRSVDLAIGAGEILGLVGESGSGKTTIGRICIGLLNQSGGEATLDGMPLYRLGRRKPGILGAVLQHPEWSLDPLMSIGRSIAEPLKLVDGISRDERRARVLGMLAKVGLGADLIERFPRELSGGQRQRASIARALITHPRFILFDEAVSALDVSIQAQILNLIRDVQESAKFAGLFISHDIAAVRSIATRIAVLLAGEIVECAPAHHFFRPMAHPYTRHLQRASGLIEGTEDYTGADARQEVA